jgi:hypothetical protein
MCRLHQLIDEKIVKPLVTEFRPEIEEYLNTKKKQYKDLLAKRGLWPKPPKDIPPHLMERVPIIFMSPNPYETEWFYSSRVYTIFVPSYIEVLWDEEKENLKKIIDWHLAHEMWHYVQHMKWGKRIFDRAPRVFEPPALAIANELSGYSADEVHSLSDFILKAYGC